MPVILQCIKCKRKLRVLDRLIGKLIRCPACKTKFVAASSGSGVVSGSGVSKGKAASGSGRTVPKSMPAPRPLATPVGRAPVTGRAPASPSPRSGAGRAGPRDLAVEHGEEDFMAAPAVPKPRSGANLDHIEASAPRSAKRRPAPQASFLSVFVTLGIILLATMLLGLLCGWLVNSKIHSFQGRKMAGAVQRVLDARTI
jgi:hypothetical protein